MQENLICSHAAGVGDILSPEQSKRLMALRINVLAKGFSGISVGTLKQMVDAFNCGCVSAVPCQGTVGASGDLAPLSHLALGLLGQGQMYSPLTGWGAAADVLSANSLQPLKLQAKEGLALINGTQLITSIGTEALIRAETAALQADVITALTIEGLQGTATPFGYPIHEARPHRGQLAVAKRISKLFHDKSEIMSNHADCGKVQDAYALRCSAQVSTRPTAPACHVLSPTSAFCSLPLRPLRRRCMVLPMTHVLLCVAFWKWR